MRRDHALVVLRLLSGGMFVAFGVGKFVNRASELASFKSYAVPAPDVFVVVIGLIEVVGGLLLIAGVLTRPAALVLAGDMIGAIVLSGVAKGELISLTLAPVLLVSMLVLLRISDARGRGEFDQAGLAKRAREPTRARASPQRCKETG